MNEPLNTHRTLVAIASIQEGSRQRAFDPLLAEAYAGTLPTLGMKQPIEVSRSGDGYRLLDGKHRLEAAKLVGWDQVPITITKIDDGNEDASAALHEAFANLARGELTALDRMAHLAAAKAAHDTLYPKAAKGGRPKKATRADDENRPIFGQFGFAQEAATHIGLGKARVNGLIATWHGLSFKSRSRLPGTAFARKDSELAALAAEDEVSQELVLDLLLSQPPQVGTVADAVAIIERRDRPDPRARKIERFARDLGQMNDDERAAIFEANEAAVQRFAVQRGWVSWDVIRQSRGGDR